MEQEIEFVARAFYEAEDAGSDWDVEPQVIKDEFRSYARKAIALLQDEFRDIARIAIAALDEYELVEA